MMKCKHSTNLLKMVHIVTQKLRYYDPICSINRLFCQMINHLLTKLFVIRQRLNHKGVHFYAKLSQKVSENRIKTQENVKTTDPKQANIRQDRMFVYQENCFFNQNAKAPFQGRKPAFRNYKL